MVYVSSLGLSSASRQSVMQAQNDLATVQKELSSGTLADAGLTLGAKSGRMVDLGAEQNRLQALTDSNAIATTRLSATTSALDALRSAASSFLSTLSTATTATTSSTLVASAQSDLAALTSTLNTSVSGQYIFAGINSDQAPMTTYVQSPASANKQAVDNAFSTAFGFSQTSSGADAVSGSDMQNFLDGPFAALFDAAGYGADWSSASDQVMTSRISPDQTATTSVSANATPFRQLAQAYTMITEFGGSAMSSAGSQAAILSARDLITQALTGLTNIEAGVGVAQASITTANDTMSAQVSLLSTQFGNLDGVDSYALSLKVSSLQTQIQSSFELTAQLKQMSLANYLS